MWIMTQDGNTLVKAVKVFVNEESSLVVCTDKNGETVELGKYSTPRICANVVSDIFDRISESETSFFMPHYE